MGGKSPSSAKKLDSTATSPMKYVSKVVVESQLSQVREALRKTRRESDGLREKLKFVAAKLECTEAQLQDASELEDERIAELRQLGKERDQAWKSELEAIHEQHRIDSSALSSAMNEIQRLRLQLEVSTRSESAQKEKASAALSEVRRLQHDMEETLSFAEKFKTRVAVLEASELKCQELINEKSAQLEIASQTIKTLQSERERKLEVGEELKKVKIQSEQWRKAAETATAILVTEDNGCFIDDTTKPMNSPSAHHGDDASADDSDDSPKKRSSTVMKKIGGVLWKKGQKQY